MTFKILPKFCGLSRCHDNAKTDLYRDDTEVTNCTDFDDCYDTIDSEMSKVTVGTSVSLEESLESSFMELQHEMREKTSQCVILRETLTTMSATMRRLEFQLKEKETELDEKVILYEQKTAECEHWKVLYDALESKFANGMSNAEMPLTASAEVDRFMLAHYNYKSFTNRRPWRSSIDGDNDNWDDLSACSDSIDEHYGLDFGLHKSKTKKSSKRKTKPKQTRIQKPVEKECILTDKSLKDTEQIFSVVVTEENNLWVKNNVTEQESMLSDATPDNMTPSSHDIEFVPSEQNNVDEKELNEIENLLNSSWGNIEHQLSEEDPPHHFQREEFTVAAIPRDIDVKIEFETDSFHANSPGAIFDDEQKARRLRRRVIRTAKRAARKAQFQCEVLEF